MNLYDVIKNVITEGSAQYEAGKYVLKWTLSRSQALEVIAVEAAFEGVKVANVNTIYIKPKAKTRWTLLVLQQN